MIEKQQGVALIHVLTKLFIKSDVNEQKNLMFRIKHTNDSYVINDIFQKVRTWPITIAPELNNLHTIQNMSH